MGNYLRHPEKEYLNTCNDQGRPCLGDIYECDQAKRCLLAPGKAPGDPERERDYGWETV